MNNSGNTICAKNYFLDFFGFFPTKSQIRKSSKMGIPENPSKVVQLHKSINSSRMVVRGWYMTHFDRRDLLHSKKLGVGWLRTLSDCHGPICEFSRFFRNFTRFHMSWKTDFFNFRPRNFFSKINFHQKFWFSLKLWYFSSILVYLLFSNSQ